MATMKVNRAFIIPTEYQPTSTCLWLPTHLATHHIHGPMSMLCWTNKQWQSTWNRNRTSFGLAFVGTFFSAKPFETDIRISDTCKCSLHFPFRLRPNAFRVSFTAVVFITSIVPWLLLLLFVSRCLHCWTHSGASCVLCQVSAVRTVPHRTMKHNVRPPHGKEKQNREIAAKQSPCAQN